MSLTTVFSKTLPWFHLVGTFFEAWSCFVAYLMGLFLYFMDLMDYFDDLAHRSMLAYCWLTPHSMDLVVGI